MTPAEWHRARRAAYRAAGLCTECGAQPAPAGYRKCKRCRATKARAWAKRKALENGVAEFFRGFPNPRR